MFSPLSERFSSGSCSYPYSTSAANGIAVQEAAERSMRKAILLILTRVLTSNAFFLGYNRGTRVEFPILYNSGCGSSV